MDTLTKTEAGTDFAVNPAEPAAPPVNPLTQVTDEYLHEQARFVVSRRLRAMLEKLQLDFYDVSPEFLTPEYLRACWDDAITEWADRTDRHDYEISVQWQYREYIEEYQEEIAQQIWEDSPEHKAQVEEERLRQEELEAEQAEKMAIWEESQRLRREHDAKLPDLGRQNLEDLCYQIEEFHHEFFARDFLSKEFCGYDCIWDDQRRGYYLPGRSGISNFFFSAKGSLFIDDLDGTVSKKPEFRTSFVFFYARWVLGYQPNSENRFPPNLWRHAINGVACWLKIEKAKKEGTFFEHGTFQYWDTLLDYTTRAMFTDRLEEKDGKLEGTFRDAPRNVFKTVCARLPEKERSLFSELATEKTFKTFLRACCEGGEHRERSLFYFNTVKINWNKAEKFEFTFNPECIPAPEVTPEEDDEVLNHCAGLMTDSGILHTAVAPKRNLPAELEDQYQAAKAAYENGYCGDECALAEAEAENQD